MPNTLFPLFILQVFHHNEILLSNYKHQQTNTWIHLSNVQHQLGSGGIKVLKKVFGGCVRYTHKHNCVRFAGALVLARVT